MNDTPESAAADPTPAPAAARAEPETLGPGEGETIALGIAIGGFAEFMDSKAGRLMMTGTKVLLVNAMIFLPLIAMGFLIFS